MYNRQVSAHLVGLYQDEDVVDPNGEDEEGHDLYDDESGWYADITEETERHKH